MELHDLVPILQPILYFANLHFIATLQKVDMK